LPLRRRRVLLCRRPLRSRFTPTHPSQQATASAPSTSTSFHRLRRRTPNPAPRPPVAPRRRNPSASSTPTGCSPAVSSCPPVCVAPPWSGRELHTRWPPGTPAVQLGPRRRRRPSPRTPQRPWAPPRGQRKEMQGGDTDRSGLGDGFAASSAPFRSRERGLRLPRRRSCFGRVFGSASLEIAAAAAHEAVPKTPLRRIKLFLLEI
jgi:hypothetical protein